MNPEYPQDWLIEATSRSFQGTSGIWISVPKPGDPVTTIYLHGHYLSRRTDESTLDFIHRAGEWAAQIYREQDIVKLTDAFLGRQEADARYRNELHRVFPDLAWFEVKAHPRQKNPVAMQVCWGCPTYGLFEVPFRIPRKSRPGHIYRTIPIPEIGRQVAPPQENP